ncbi:MAG: hypothetical protein QW374_01325 [Candidatus Bathyarchaeia archaeon]|nr:hypothetical protein [Candidatus Bathyarchaeota archaeon]
MHETGKSIYLGYGRLDALVRSIEAWYPSRFGKDSIVFIDMKDKSFILTALSDG